MLLIASLVFIFVNVKIIKGITSHNDEVWNLIMGWYLFATAFSSIIYVKFGMVSTFSILSIIALITIMINFFIFVLVIVNKNILYSKNCNVHLIKRTDKVITITFILVLSIISIAAISSVAIDYGTSIRKVMGELKGTTVYEGFVTCAMKSGDERDVCLTVLSITTENQEIPICSYVKDEFLKVTCERGTSDD